MTEFINSQKRAYPDLAAEYENFSELYSQKLWHQLSIALEEFLLVKSNLRNRSFAELYFQFISKFESRLSQMRVARLVSMIGHDSFSPNEAIDFFCTVLKSRERLGAEASLFLDIDVAEEQLKLGQMASAKSFLDDTKETLQKKNFSEAVVYSKFYKVLAEYHKVVGTAQEFYRAVLLYLAYTPLDELNGDEKFIWATDMALAAIVGDMVYNFGEVIATPILSSLVGSPNEWIFNLVNALNDGDIDRFNLIVDPESSPYFTQPALVRDHELVKQKVVLVALMNLVYERPAHERTISYSDISARLRVPVDQVDWVLMKALSLGLIKGKIDECDQSIDVSWVQPKVLNMDQIKHMEESIGQWMQKVKTSLVTVTDQTADLFA